MELNAKTRTVLGKKVKHLRKEGFIPAELYGHGVENKHLKLSEKEFVHIHKETGGHTIVQVITESGEKIPVLISEVQYNPLSGRPLSVDLHRVRMDEIIETSVPIEFKGTPPAEKSGFLVVKVLSEVEIETLPGNIPHSFEVNLSTLSKPGESIHVSDIKISEEIKILVPPETVVASVTEREKEEEAPPDAETTAKTAPETAETPTKPTEEKPTESSKTPPAENKK